MSSLADTMTALVDIGDPNLVVTPDAEFGSRTTYRVGGRAAICVEANSAAALSAALAVIEQYGVDHVTLGRGSNMLVSDAGFGGVVIALGSWAEQITIDPPDSELSGSDEVIVVAGGAAQLPVVARRTASAGLTGFEWAVGVPGSIGGAVRMNAGGHGSDMAASLVSVDIVSTGGVTTVDASALGLGFRSSELTDGQIVTAARLAVRREDRDITMARVDDIVRWRRENQPGGQNCGSVFVNPEPGRVAAGELIDRLGLRGFRVGTAEVSTKHANFIQADHGGRADDVAAVMAEVRGRVEAETGYRLRSEVRLIGFTDSR